MGERVRLKEGHEFYPFDCDDFDLNDFLMVDAILYTKNLLSVTCHYEEDNKTLWFFSALNDKISLQDTSKSLWNKLRKTSKFPNEKRLSSYPAVKIGRPGVHKEYQSTGIGTEILNYIKFLFIDNNKTGCRFITVDAYNNDRTINFYQKNGFHFLKEDDAEEETRLMVFDLAPVAQFINM